MTRLSFLIIGSILFGVGVGLITGSFWASICVGGTAVLACFIGQALLENP